MRDLHANTCARQYILGRQTENSHVLKMQASSRKTEWLISGLGWENLPRPAKKLLPLGIMGGTLKRSLKPIDAIMLRF